MKMQNLAMSEVRICEPPLPILWPSSSISQAMSFIPRGSKSLGSRYSFIEMPVTREMMLDSIWEAEMLYAK